MSKTGPLHGHKHHHHHKTGPLPTFEQLDTNHDGKLTGTELEKVKGYDTGDKAGTGKGDGTITKDEFLAGRHTDAHKHFEKKLDGQFAKLDGNHDGKLSGTELGKLKHYAAADGTLDRAGYEKALHAEHKKKVDANFEDAFKQLDGNQDGVLTGTEAKGFKNTDGKDGISEDEFKAQKHEQTREARDEKLLGEGHGGGHHSGHGHTETQHPSHAPGSERHAPHPHPSGHGHGSADTHPVSQGVTQPPSGPSQAVAPPATPPATPPVASPVAPPATPPGRQSGPQPTPPSQGVPEAPAPVHAGAAPPLPPSDTAATVLAAANRALSHAPDPIVGVFNSSARYLPGQDGVDDPNRDMSKVNKLVSFASDVNALCGAYALTKDPRYAQKATQLVDAWSHSMDTSLGNPNAHYEVYFHLSSMANSLQALQGYSGWGAAQKAHSLDWMHGLATSALQMKSIGNNLDDWRTLFAGNVAVLTGDHALFQKMVSSWQSNVSSQITADGMLPGELRRTKTLTYSQYALKPMVAFAEQARAQGVDLYGTEAGRKLETALQKIGPALVDHSLWKSRDIALAELTPDKSYLTYRLAAERYPANPAIRKIADELEAKMATHSGWKARLVNSTMQGGNAIGFPLSVGAAFSS